MRASAVLVCGIETRYFLADRASRSESYFRWAEHNDCPSEQGLKSTFLRNKITFAPFGVKIFVYFAILLTGKVYTCGFQHADILQADWLIVKVFAYLQ